MSEKRLTDSIYQSIFQIVRHIPVGRVTSYGAIAKALGVAGGARLVGYAMNASHSEVEYVPAHRVVNRLGLLTGRHHFSPSESMQTALEAEGIKVVDHQIQDFDSHFWDPSTELGL